MGVAMVRHKKDNALRQQGESACESNDFDIINGQATSIKGSIDPLLAGWICTAFGVLALLLRGVLV